MYGRINYIVGKLLDGRIVSWCNSDYFKFATMTAAQLKPYLPRVATLSRLCFADAQSLRIESSVCTSWHVQRTRLLQSTPAAWNISFMTYHRRWEYGAPYLTQIPSAFMPCYNTRQSSRRSTQMLNQRAPQLELCLSMA